MEVEGKGNGGPTYKGREVKGGGEKGRRRVPRLLRFPGSRGARIVTARTALHVNLCFGMGEAAETADVAALHHNRP